MTRMGSQRCILFQTLPLSIEGGTQCSMGAGWVIAPRHQCLLLISPPGVLMIFLFSACATSLGRLASRWPLWLQ